MFDVVIAGGGVAGLSAALVLGRARRTVLVCGEGAPRNAPAAHAHGFFTRDGATPSELLRIGRAQLRPYESVRYREVAVADAGRRAGRVEVALTDDEIALSGAAPHDGHFAVLLGDGDVAQARRLLLATGVVDTLPPIPGLADLWGTGVFHCPYCHGWEVRDQPLAVLNNGPMGVEQALLISQWSRDLVLCTDGPATLTAGAGSPRAASGCARSGSPVWRAGRAGSSAWCSWTARAWRGAACSCTRPSASAATSRRSWAARLCARSPAWR